MMCEECGMENTVDNLCEHYTLEDNDPTTLEEVLISLVEVRPPLWDTRLPIQARSRTIRDDLWTEILSTLEGDYTAIQLQKKWKNLRDTYIRAKSETDVYIPSGSGAKKRKKPWKYFEIMSFLSETVSPKSTTTNLTDSPLISPDPEMNPGSSKISSNKGENKVESAILEAIHKLPPPPKINTETKINPICMQISKIMDELPSRKRAQLEIEFLTRAYAVLHEESE